MFKGKIKVMVIACILLVGIIVAGGWSVAAYRARAEAVSVGGVAAYAMSAGTESDDLFIDCNTDSGVASYVFWVKNSVDGAVTEVSAKYSVEVVFPSALPEGLTVQLDGVDGVVSSDGKTYTFTNSAWVFDAGVEVTRTHALLFVADASAIESNLSISGIVVKVMTEQIG